MPSSVPDLRVSQDNDAGLRPEGAFVLYWMSSARRTEWNFALDRAIELATEVRRPLVIVETLAADSPWMNPRHARMILAGMADNARELGRKRIDYFPCVAADSARLARALSKIAAEAAAVVADWNPIREAVRFTSTFASDCPVRLERVDSNGLLPLAATERPFPRAYSFRRFLQKNLPDHLPSMPADAPKLPKRFPRIADFPAKSTKLCLLGLDEVLEEGPAVVARHCSHNEVPPVELRGGSRSGRETLDRFLESRLARYEDERNQPESDASSGLSPYLHHGHVSAHEVFSRLARQQQWSPDRLAEKASGSREGWWGMTSSAEAFLDELITWRELGYNMCHHRDDYDDRDSLPDWARETLDEHVADYRAYEYSFEEFRDGVTHDELWNAAQGQLLVEGIIHNYLRMLWGKKILEWTSDWQTALEVMIELNNTYGVDGCDPNSYSGIFWVLGRYDRPWGPEREIFGKVRYMSSANTARKVRVRDYIEQYSIPAAE